MKYGLIFLFLFSGFLRAERFQNKPLEHAPIELFSLPINRPLILNPTGYQLVSDPDTRIDTIIINTPYLEDPFFWELMKNLRSDINIVCLVKSEKNADFIWQKLSKLKIKNLYKRLRFVVTKLAPRLSRWGRDPFIVLANPETNQYTLVSAFIKGSKRADDWEDRSLRTTLMSTDFTASDVVNAGIDRVPTWLIEGGAITSDETFAFIGHGTLLVSSREDDLVVPEADVVQSLEKVTGKKLIVLPAADLHSDRFHIPVGKTKFGEHTSLLSDPVKALEILASLTPQERRQAFDEIQKLGLDWENKAFAETKEGQNLMARFIAKLNSKDLENFLEVTQDEIEKIRQSLNTQRRDQAEKLLGEEGIAVVRLPVLNRNYVIKLIEGDSPNETERTEVMTHPMTLAYTNIIQDCDKKRKTVFIPRYGIKKLDDYVYNVFKSLGRFDRIVQLNSVQEATGDGGPRCRVQVLGMPSRRSTSKKTRS